MASCSEVTFTLPITATHMTGECIDLKLFHYSGALNFGDELINSQMIEPMSEVKQTWGQIQAILLAVLPWVKYDLSSFFKA